MDGQGRMVEKKEHWAQENVYRYNLVFKFIIVCAHWVFMPEFNKPLIVRFLWDTL